MPAPRSRRRARLAALVSAALAITGFQFLVAAPAAQAVGSTGLVINEVYGGGGSSSAAASYKTDFVELYNPTNGSLSLNGMSLQYRSAGYTTGTVSVAALPNVSVASHDYYLASVSAAATPTAGGADLPSPDFTSTALNMAAGAGQVILSSGISQITTTGTSMQGVSGVVDFVGYGPTSTSSETAPTTTATANNNSISRATLGVDSDKNNLDFAAPTTPSPTHGTPVVALSLASITDKSGTVGLPITGFNFVGSGGTGTLTYSATGLPDGVTVNSTTGAVSGTPTTACACSVTAKVTDGAATEKTTTFNFTVTAPLALASVTDKSGTVGAAITNFTLSASGGTPSYAYSATGLPAGVSVDPSTGVVSGTPTAACTCAVTAKVTDGAATEKTTTFNFTVNTPAVPLALASVTDKSGTVGAAITNFTLSASGGTPSYTYSATGLPTGVSVDPSTGVVSGTPTAACTCAVTAKVTDSTSAEATQTFAFNVSQLAVTNPGDQSFTKDTAITPFSIQSTGGTAPLSYAVTGGSLPAGLSLAQNGPNAGQISGTPTAVQAATSVTVTVTDANSVTASTTFNITVADSSVEPATHDIQILGINDFHGRIANDPTTGSAGAAVIAGAVKQFRAANPETIFAAAGDLIGASTFESFIDKDKPTIDALNSAGLDVSSVGNHEFDQGSDDLINRVMNPAAPKGGAAWQYLASNIRNKTDNTQPIPATWTKDFGSVKVGFIGAVTNHLPELVSPAGISTINVTPIVTEVNTAANALDAQGADLIVLLVHEGAGQAGAAACTGDLVNPASDMGLIAAGVNSKVDAIISGHTHLEYDCDIAVPAWQADPTHPVKLRPIVSAGMYGVAMNKLNFSVDTASGTVLSDTHSILKMKNGTTGSNFNYPEDPATKAIVDAAVANAGPLGAVTVGKINKPLYRGKLADGTTENRGQESTLGNQVAEAQKDATKNAAQGGAVIAFMNPGGLRQDLLGTVNGGSRDVSYRQAADVQPFGNTLVNETLTGAQIKTVLEQQWQPAGAARPFLKLGISKGLTYNYDPSAATGSHIKQIWLNGTPINPASTYSVTVNSFLSSGGDNFFELNNGTGKHDVGQVDLQAFVNYMGQFGTTPLQVDYTQRAVGVSFPASAPASYQPGDAVKFDVSSWAMTGPGDTQDTAVDVTLGATSLGSFNLTNTAVAATDEAGKASINVTLPVSTPVGTATLTLTGAQTGTSTTVTVNVTANKAIQILGINDFHGRIANDPTTGSAGAAVIAGAVKQLRGQNPNTVFAAAGDLIGASTFESFIDQDKPTIDALNSAGLEVSSVGNHEFDQGFNDLVNRVMNPAAPKGGAQWQYLAANIRNKSDGQRPIASTWTKDFGNVKVGFIGAVTNHLPELVSPSGLLTIDVTPIVTEVNQSADALDAAGADLIVLLVHEGAAQAGAAACTGDLVDPASDMGKIAAGVNSKVDAIISGHTHLEYDCDIAVPAWQSDPTHPVKSRPIVSAGMYGVAMNKLDFQVEAATGVVLSDSHSILKMKNGTTGSNFNYPEDPATKAIVDAAVANAGPLGAVTVGKINKPLYRGKLADGTTENRGQESTLGNQVAEAQKDATKDPAQGGAVIAFMNPGGLRQDLLGTVNGGSRDVSYRQAADVQPFGNTLVNETLTGAQIKTVLEQQWQPAGAARPFLKLGISQGFTYTYDPAAATGSHIKQMWLNGTPINPASTYSVTVNSFLSSGGDNFLELNNGTGKHDVGQVDLQAFVTYMGKFASTPLQVDYTQRAVGVTFPAAAPATYVPGDHVKFDVSSFAMTGPGDTQDTAVDVKVGATTLGSFNLTNTAVATTDEAGKASVDVTVPNGQAPGSMTLTLVGAQTGTTSTVTVTVGQATSTTGASDQSITYGQTASFAVTVTGPGATPGGTVHLKDGATELDSDTLDASGQATLTVPAKTYHVGTANLSVVYDGDTTHSGSTKAVTLTTTKTSSTTAAPDGAVDYGQATTVVVSVTAPDSVVPTGTVTIKDGATVVGSAALAAGSATVPIPATSLSVGAHSLTAEYSGDGDVTASSDGLTLTVSKATSTVTAPDVTVPVGSTGTETVTVTAVGVTPTGTVTLKNGATVIGSASVVGGAAQFNLPAIADGTVITADYSGDGNVKPGSDTFTVHQGSKATAVLAVGDVTVEYGTAATVTAHVSASVTATGTVTVKNGATTLGTGTVSGGVATITLPAGSLPVGSATLSADYSGDTNVNGAVKPFSVTVTKGSSATAVKVKPKHPKKGHKVKLKVTVTGSHGVPATGTVSVKIGGKTITGQLKGGKGTLVITATDIGNLGKAVIKALVVYSGDNNLAGSSKKVKIKLK